MDLRYKDDEGAIKSSRLLIEAHGSLEELAVKLGTNLEVSDYIYALLRPK